MTPNPVTTPILCPAQEQAMNGLRWALSIADSIAIWGGTGSGKSTVLRRFAEESGARLLTMNDVVKGLRPRRSGNPPAALRAALGQGPDGMAHVMQSLLSGAVQARALDGLSGAAAGIVEATHHLLTSALQDHRVVILDDLELLACGCARSVDGGTLDSMLTGLLDDSEAKGRKLIFGGNPPAPVRARAHLFGIDAFQPRDYEAIWRHYLGDRAPGVDFKKVHRFAPNLNAHQLKRIALWQEKANAISTDQVIEHLRVWQLISNVNLAEVQSVALSDLKGVDRLIESLEAHVILPLENDELATELGLKPKRGVLLAGPPGTGKTTVGRALAHRLRSKFFLVDGTVISGTGGFYQAIERIFAAAKQNAPSIIFIDDTDVIFESGYESGLYRYLLTMLDGLESEGSGRICVMLTAMNVANLPPALLRSGRVELWLETSLPGTEARAAILRQHLEPAQGVLANVDAAALVAASDGLTGADLKRVVEDGKLLLAYDRSRGLPSLPATTYFLDAITLVQENKERYAEAEAAARRKRPSRPPWFDASDYDEPD